jgi:hypothetical protein
MRANVNAGSWAESRRVTSDRRLGVGIISWREHLRSRRGSEERKTNHETSNVRDA